jgi:thymidylate synthase
MMFLNEVREKFAEKYNDGDYLAGTIDISPITFLADEESIFGEVNKKYVDHEIAWYESQSLNVNDIPGGAPEIWKRVATADGHINSNYGWCIYSKENGYQYANVFEELSKTPTSRRGIMIYNRPSMHTDQKINDMQDFMCTNTVQYFVRDGQLHAHVSMRSNDAIFGYKNDRAWQQHVLVKLANDLGLSIGNLYWTAGSLHIYERHFYLVNHFFRSGGELTISKKEYDTIYK